MIAGKMVRGLSDERLLERLGELVAQRSRLASQLVAHIAEVDRRRLFARSAHSSMFDYCVRRLGLSEGAAYRHITAARKSRDLAELLGFLERGTCTLRGSRCWRRI